MCHSVTLGEMMLSHARALFLDEISTGLDSAATFDIVCALQRWTRVMNGSATVALLQPSPEVLALFDNLILMRHGQIVFSGSQSELRAHFARINIQPEEEEAIDFADWLVDFLTDPQAIWKRDMERKIERNRGGKASARKSFREHHLHHTQQQQPQQDAGGKRGVAEEKHKEEEEAPHVGLNNYSDTPNAAAEEANGNGNGNGAHAAAVQPVIHVSPAQQTNGADGTLQPAPSSWAQDSEAAAVVFHLGEEEEQGHSDNGNEENAAGNANNAVPHAHGANGHANGNGSAVIGAASGRKKGLGKVFRAADMPPLSTPALRKAFEESAVHQSVLAEIATRNQALRQKHEEEIRAAAATTDAHGSNAVAAAAAVPGAPHSPFTRAQLFSAHSWSVWHHTRVCLHRQSQFYARSPEFIFPRLFQSIFMGLVFGSLFYQLGTSNSDFSPRLGLMLSSLIFAAFANMSEVPVASEFKMVVYKQIDAGMYSTFRSEREREREKTNKQNGRQAKQRSTAQCQGERPHR